MSEMISGLESSRGSAIPTREYVSEVVSLLKQSEDIGADRKVAQGYRDLFTAIFTSSLNPEDSSVKAMHVLTPKELKELRKTVNTLFLQCTLTEPTSFYRSKKTGKTHDIGGLNIKTPRLIQHKYLFL